MQTKPIVSAQGKTPPQQSTAPVPMVSTTISNPLLACWSIEYRLRKGYLPLPPLC